MITICPLVGETKEEQIDVYAVLNDNNEIEYNDSHGNSLELFILKGFRTEEAKALWYNTFLPMISFGAFDPQI